MKTLLFTIVSAFIINTAYAQQNDLAYLNSNELETYKPSIIKKNVIKTNTNHYYKTIFNNNTSKHVANLEKEILNYKIKNEAIYNATEAASYQVKFKRKNARALVTYSNSGEILSSNEIYHNIKVPYEISVSIAKSFPGWALEKSTLKIAYDHTKTLKKVYMIVIRKDGLNKHIEFDNMTLN
ncbi:hypothetical protein [uncultured Algibacter sp.]|uniref:hypothetical protein n=1 Tax=uncultured Algibacter sp. TaxID=298659 RepID=UPI002638921F|nr:hypothetical protein [uncultured Algibacter sp.]